MGCSARSGRAAFVVVLLAVGAVRPASGQEPMGPGAVTSCPPWLKSGAPFDVEAFFRWPQPGKNAAPLYLEAFAEFTPGADVCLPGGKGKVAAAADRARRIDDLCDRALKKGPGAFDRKAADALLDELHDGFRKLAAAQRRPECVFATGLGVDALLPHAQASRTVARALAIRVALDVEKGNLDRPVQDVAAMLRLSRDLRPRGPMICQLVAGAIEGVVTLDLLPLLLGSPALKPPACDRLIAVLREHEAAKVDGFAEGTKGDYVMMRASLHVFQDRRATAGGPDGRPVEEKRGEDQVVAYADLLATSADDGGPKAAPGGVAEWLRGRSKSWPAERKALDEVARSLLAADGYPARIRAADALEAGRPAGRAEESPWLARILLKGCRPPILVEARSRAYGRASQGLLSLRRAELSGGKASDLAAACKAAGMPAPADPFSPSGGTLKLAVLDGRPIVYSVGTDGVDDRALVDSGLGKQPKGDMLFRLPMAPK